MNKAICKATGEALRFAFLAWAAAGPALAAGPAFQFSREIQSPALKQEELLAVALDSDVFAATQDGLADVRLLDGEGKPLPYVLRQAQTTRARRVRKTWPARQFSARPLDGGLEITVELAKDDPHPNGLTLVSPLRNFEQRVRVEASADGREWEPAGTETVIFDYSRYMDVRRDGVSFPETAKRHFRIVIDDVTVEQESELLALTRRLQGAEETERTEKVVVDRRPFRIERIDFWREVEQEQSTGDEKAKYPVTGYRVEQDAAKHQTIVRLDARRQPLTALKLKTPDRNFSRHAAVEVEEARGVSKTWRRLGEATVSRIDFKDVQREDLSISFPQSRAAEYRITIDDRDSPPLAIAGVEAEGNVYELVCLAAPDARYRLVYGSADADAATYDTAAIQELLRSGFQPSRAKLGEQQPGPGAGQPAEFEPSTLLNNPLLLGAVILLLVLALGWGLYHAVKRMDKLPSE
ncbi:MAG TPA: DUF3999 family protein [Pirellulales bacterium]|nr:DUF3999 family protein [Pirellulales bacterium]